MKYGRLGRWGMVVLLAGCTSKVQVDRIGPPAEGAAGRNDVTTLPDSGDGGNAIAPSSGGSSGTNGQSCVVRATVTEAMGTPAQADLVTLGVCDLGFTCVVDKCVTLPACPQSFGECVVRSPDQGSGGASAAGGTGNIAGAPSSSIVSEPSITAIAADATNLYWSEYGTRDSLGNYQNNGAIYAEPIGGGAQIAISSDLPGALALAVTDSYVYVRLDGGGLLGSLGHPQLVRLPIAGGALEVVADSAVANLVGGGDRAFWTTAYTGPLDTPPATQATYGQLSAPGSMPNQLLDHIVSNIQRDSASLFFEDYPDLASASLSGGVVTSLGLAVLPFALKGDAIYALEGINNRTGLFLDRADKTGGTWQRVQALGAGNGVNLQIAGDRFFWAANPPSTDYPQPDESRLVIRTASFGTNSSVAQLLAVTVRETNPNTLQWVATPSVLYWTDGNGIYARALADLP